MVKYLDYKKDYFSKQFGAFIKFVFIETLKKCLGEKVAHAKFARSFWGTGLTRRDLPSRGFIRKFEVIEATSQLSVPSTVSYFNRILPRNDRFVFAPYLVFGVEEARCRPHNYPQKLVKGDGFGPIIVLLAISDLPILKTHLVVRKNGFGAGLRKR